VLCLSITLVSYGAKASSASEVEISNDSKPKGFFHQRYRGWVWFEEEPKNEQKKKKNQDHAEDDLELEGSITPEEARRENEQLKRKLDDLREVMVARPSYENVIKYIKLEEKMWKKALALDDAGRQAKLLYPEYFNKLENPENVHAVKYKRKIDAEKAATKIREFARVYDLVFFANGGCGHCTEFAPVLKRFSEEYGFKVEEASTDGNLTGYFEGKKLPELAKKLGIEATPTVVIVARDGKLAMELIRGYVTTS
jgi:conjugal transfer pilus assembly protein TraF